MTLVVGNQNGSGRVEHNRPEKRLQVLGTMFCEP